MSLYIMSKKKKDSTRSLTTLDLFIVYVHRFQMRILLHAIIRAIMYYKLVKGLFFDLKKGKSMIFKKKKR